MNFFRKHIVILFFLIFPAVCYLMYNTVANIHSHNYKGKIITHAHPVSKEVDSQIPVKTHNHTDYSFFLLDKVFYFFFYVVCGLGVMTYFVITFKKRLYQHFQIPFRNIFFNYTNLRAPPVQLLSF